MRKQQQQKKENPLSQALSVSLKHLDYKKLGYKKTSLVKVFLSQDVTDGYKKRSAIGEHSLGDLGYRKILPIGSTCIISFSSSGMASDARNHPLQESMLLNSWAYHRTPSVVWKCVGIISKQWMRGMDVRGTAVSPKTCPSFTAVAFNQSLQKFLIAQVQMNLTHDFLFPTPTPSVLRVAVSTTSLSFVQVYQPSVLVSLCYLLVWSSCPLCALYHLFWCRHCSILCRGVATVPSSVKKNPLFSLCHLS